MCEMLSALSSQATLIAISPGCEILPAGGLPQEISSEAVLLEGRFLACLFLSPRQRDARRGGIPCARSPPCLVPHCYGGGIS